MKRTMIEISIPLHKQLRALHEKSKVPIKYLVEEAIKAFVELNKEVK